MIRFLFTFILLLSVSVGFFAYRNSQNTFEATFKNIDGLPKGARVTALGVKIGEVIRTKPVHDGIIVTVKITNKNVPKPPSGSQLTITSFRPNEGRVLEIIPPDTELSETKAWLTQEPITTESWLHAGLDLLEGLKSFSEIVIKYVTPENFEKARDAFAQASDNLNQTVFKLYDYEATLIDLKDKITYKTNQTNALLVQLQKPIISLNKIISDKKTTESFKSELTKLSDDLASISGSITSQKFTSDVVLFKTMVLDHLNNVNATLTALDKDVEDSQTKEKIKEFNQNLTELNSFYEKIKTEDVQKLKVAARKVRDLTTSAAEETKEAEKKAENFIQN